MRSHDLQEHFLAKLRSGLAVLAVVSLATLATACGGGGDDEDEEGGSGTETDFSGVWSITESVDDNCFDESYTETYELTLTQSGSTVTIDDGTEVEDATASGDTISWSREEEEEGATMTYEGSATVDGDSMTGEAEWTITMGGESCSGSSTFVGTRISGGDDTGGGDTGGDDTGGGDTGGGDTADGEEVEPNDSQENATQLVMSGSSYSVSGNVDDTNDTLDLFAFSPPASGSYTIALNGSDEADDIDLWVYDSNGTTLDVSENVGPQESVTINLSAGLVYYIEAYAYETLSGADYVLTVTQN